MRLRNGGDSFDWFFLAMAHRRLDHDDQARAWYDKAVEWMDKNQPNNETLRGFRAVCGGLVSSTGPNRLLRIACRGIDAHVVKDALCPGAPAAAIADRNGAR
jgi:hypothetical protein